MINKLAKLLYPVSMLGVAAFAAELLPARATGGEDALAARIEFPEIKGDTTAVLRCAARAQPNGSLKQNGCYAPTPADRLFVTVINRAALKARLIPASADGRQREIYFQYRVRFVKKGEEQTIQVLENPGVQENIDAYGEDHVAAQRAIGREPWQDECPRRAEYLVWLKAHVAADGSVSSLSLTHGAGIMPTPRCQQSILEIVQNSVFFPAHAADAPVPSTYVEPFSN